MKIEWRRVEGVTGFCHEFLVRLAINSSVLTLPTLLQEEPPLSKPREKRQRRKR